MTVSATKVIRLSAMNFFPRDTCPSLRPRGATGIVDTNTSVVNGDASLRQPEQEQDGVTAPMPMREPPIAAYCRFSDVLATESLRVGSDSSCTRQGQIAFRLRRPGLREPAVAET